MTTRNKRQYKRVHLLEIDVVFPAGISAGAGSMGNRIVLAHNARGELLLHGTAIAGVLRHAMTRLHPRMKKSKSEYPTETHSPSTHDIDYIKYFFGSAQGDSNSDPEGRPKESPLRVDDAYLTLLESQSVNRVSHWRCRHTGAVAEKALYSIDAAPPQTTACLRFQYFDKTAETKESAKGTDESPKEKATYPDGYAFFQEVLALFHQGLIFGGNGNRGVGLAQVKGAARYQCYDLTNFDEFASYLNADYAHRNGKNMEGAVQLEPATDLNEKVLKVEFTLEIPKGQDLLVADGKGFEAESQPHYVTGANGTNYWILPGSTLRGLFRNAITRLAAREGKNIADSVAQFENDQRTVRSDQLAWMFQENKKGNSAFINEIDRSWPVESLFGSLHKAGRLHITDGLSKIGDDRSISQLAADDKFPVQYRVHVAIDPISGGAIEGALFDNFVLTSGGDEHAIRFPITMILRQPQEFEVEWLAQTLRAIHTGLLRVGSSKSAGCLAIASGSLQATGANEKITKIVLDCLNAPHEKMSDFEVTAGNHEEAVSESEGDKVVLRGKMDSDIVKFTAFYTENGVKKAVVIPRTLWKYRPGDVQHKPDVELTFVNGELVDVVIPGRPVITATTSGSSSPITGSPVQNMSRQGALCRSVKPDILGSSFHNPYTFLPFSEKTPTRKPPTLQTADEIDETRFSGILELKIETLSPLLISEGWCQKEKESIQQGKEFTSSEHKKYSAQQIGDDVIVPATGVRGFLRNLMTMITGGPLVVMDEETYLCQARDLQLTTQQYPNAILARIVKPGSSKKSGTIEIGETRLIAADAIKAANRGSLPRPEPDKPIVQLWAEWDRGEICSLSTKEDARHSSPIKLSGKPVNNQKYITIGGVSIECIKKEGIFIQPLRTIDLPPSFWSAYNSRHQHGDHPELKKDDLVWIEPRQMGDEGCDITSEDDILSLQWARWGRKGKQIKELLPGKDAMMPDSHRTDGNVSAITDLFGQVPYKPGSKAPMFKGRIMPSNLVFEQGRGRLEHDVPLAVMGSPHAGCIPFYRKNKNNNPEQISKEDGLRGYKVYRQEEPESTPPPWRFTTQGVYEDSGRIKPGSCQKVNISADLLAAKTPGKLTLSLRGLTSAEMALLLLVCKEKATWRLGGGKPLGLGACQVKGIHLYDESGKMVDPAMFVVTDEQIKSRFATWEKIQVPVKKLRYPRAVVRNNNKNTRGGMTWFQKCASVKKGEEQQGLVPIYITGKLLEQAKKRGSVPSATVVGNAVISGQILPFNPNHPELELLYGYDAFFCDSERERFGSNYNNFAYPEIATFDEEKHISGMEKSAENLSQNQENRRKGKENRSS